MADQMAFEARLTDAYARYVAAAPTEVDAVAVARAAAAGAVRHAGARSAGARLSFPWPAVRPMRLVIVGALLLALAATVVIVGTLLLRSAPVPKLSALPDLALPRTDPIVVGLADGRVLIAGGQISTDRTGQPVEILDPTTRAITRIEADTPTGSGVGVQLTDGRVLVIAYDSNQTCSRAALIDPVSATSRVLPQDGFCNRPPFGIHGSVVALADGRVLVTGGKLDVYEEEVSRAAVLFDPVTETFEPTGLMTTKRIGHGLALLADGRVLVAGGNLTDRSAEDPVEAVAWNALNTLEIYDPSTGTFAAAGSMQLLRGPTMAVPLEDGRVALLADQRRGVRDAQQQVYSGPAESVGPFPVELYDPATGTTSVMGTIPHAASGAFPIRGGRLLVHGWVLDEPEFNRPGINFDIAHAWAVVFDAASGRIVELPAPRTALSSSAALPDGRVILAGGWTFPPAGAGGSGTGEGAVVGYVDLFE